MNFFGHAVVASWTDPSAAFVLGSMVPDFATMMGARVPAALHEEVARGVEFHLRTDRVFHDAPTFRRLMADARRDLRERGLPRPSALAVGHIGVEILLDARLAADETGSTAYLAALRAGHPDALGAHLAWHGDEAAERYGMLITLLSERGRPRTEPDPDAVAFRVSRALSGRPRLALSEGGERLVKAWAADATAVVEAHAETLVREIVHGLGMPSV